MKKIVCLGASAGGLEPIKLFVRSIKRIEEEVCFIVAQHLSPDHQSILANLISKETQLEVLEAQDNQSLEPYKIYIAPSGYHIEIENLRIKLRPKKVKDGPIPSIDLLFKSAAENFKESLFGIILSGTGSDGAEGLKSIKEKGGVCLVQKPETAKYDGMPNAAIRSGFADFTAPVEELWEIVKQLVSDGMSASEGYEHTYEENEIFKRIREVKEIDFDQYKPNTLTRRIQKRITQLGVKDQSVYLDLLKDEGEVNELFQTLLIGFTYFFRNQPQFALLKEKLSELLQAKEDNRLRVWVPGCASGEEAYTLGIIIQELEVELNKKFKVQIFATDIDPRSLDKARRGIFDEIALEEVREDILAKYFKKEGKQFEIDKEIRSKILFSKHDITRDPYFLNLDLISCRNLLIYLKKEVQSRLIPLFHHSLNEDGLLLLGESENIRGYSSLFERLETSTKLYRKKYNPNQQRFMLNRYRTKLKSPKEPDKPSYTLNESISYSLFEHNDDTIIVVNDTGEIIHIKGDTEKLFKVPQGSPKTDIFSLTKDRINIELRRLLDLVKKENNLVENTTKSLILNDETYEMRCRVFPLEKYQSSENLYVYAIKLTEKPIKPKYSGKTDNGESTADEFDRIIELENELVITKEYLQSYVEELETANEELQSMNEELQSTNEELQSSNEELETSNEELQSTSEEMQTAYNELRQANNDLEEKEKALRNTKENMSSLLNNSMQAFLLFDIKGNVIEYNQEALQQISKWNVDEIELGMHFSAFVPPSILGTLQTSFKKALKGNRVQDSFSLKVGEAHLFYEFNFSAVLGTDERVQSVSLGIIDFTEYNRLKGEIQSSQKLIDSIFKSVNIGVFIADEDGIIKRVNDRFLSIFDYKAEDLLDQPFTQIIPAQSRKQAMMIYKGYLEDESEWPYNWKMATKTGNIIDADTKPSLITDADDNRLVIVTVQDVTETLKYKTILEEAGHSAKLGGWELDTTSETLEWTEEVYEIYEIPYDTPINVELAKSCYEGSALDKLEEKISQSIETGLPYDIIVPFKSKKGTKKWVRTTCKPILDNGYTVKLLGTIQDVTKSKQAEVELKKLSLVATNAMNSIIITDDRGYIEWVNNAFTKTTGYKQSEAKGVRPGDLLQGEDTDPLMAYEIGNALDNGIAFNGTILNYKKNGEKYWNELSITPVKDENGTVVQFVSVQSDITDRINLQKDLEASLAEKESLLKEVHHRVKNNLALVNAMLFLQESESKDEIFNKLINETQNRIKSIASVHEIIYQTESFSNIRVDIYLNKIIKELQESFAQTSDRVQIETHIQEARIEVEQAIPFALICNEVVTNSIKHSYPGDEEGVITVEMEDKNGMISFKVFDDGVGLPDDFDPYTKKSLGMTLITQFSKQLDGKFEFKNRKKGGSEFQLRFEHKKDYHSF